MTLKTMIFGFAAAGVGGVATMGGSFGSHDAERVIARPPAEVYAALSAMAEEGVRESPAESEAPGMKLEVRKEKGAAVHYSLSLEGEEIASLDFQVAAENGGAATRLSADIALDQAALAKLADPDRDEPFTPLPKPLVNLAVAQMLGEIAADIEAGKALPAFGPHRFGGWNGRAAGPAMTSEMRERDERLKELAEQARKPTPSAGAEPMVDPNEAARAYLNGGR